VNASKFQVIQNHTDTEHKSRATFEYACFMSYRQTRTGEVPPLVQKLFENLSEEITDFWEKEIFLDRERLRAGDRYNEILACKLCKSVCMIAVYTPVYFHEQHTYCAREYYAMQQLEKTRLQGLPKSEQEKGLIIPIVLKGEEFLPLEVKSCRQYYNFESYALGGLRGNNMSYRKELRNIVKYILDRHRAFSKLDFDPCRFCTAFRFPTDQEIRPWLRGVLGPQNKFERQ